MGAARGCLAAVAVLALLVGALGAAEATLIRFSFENEALIDIEIDGEVTTYATVGTQYELTVADPPITVRWNAQLQEVSASDLPDTFQSLNMTRYKRFVRIAPDVFEGFLADNEPLVSVFGEVDGDAFFCGSVILFTRTSYTCNAYSNTTGMLPAIAFSIGELAWVEPHLATLEVTALDPVLAPALSVALARGMFVLQALQQIEKHGALNASRRVVASGLVAGSIVLAITAMFGLMIMLVPLLAWGLPLRFMTESASRHVALWTLIVAIILIPVSLGGGLLGWVVCGVVFSLALVSLMIAYFVISCRHRRQTSVSDAIEMDFTAQADESKRRSVIDAVRRSYRQSFIHQVDKKPRPKWSSHPSVLGRSGVIMELSGLSIFVVSVAVFFAIVVTWDVTAYYVMDRNTGEMLIEYQPATVSKSTLALYTFDGMAATMRMNAFLAPFTDWCGTYYAQPLSDDKKEVSIKENYIDLYRIDMSEFEPSDWREYTSLNEWFIRPLRPGARYIADPNDDATVVSPADARVYAFPSVPPTEQHIIKEESFTISEVFRGNEDWIGTFANSTMFIVRLAPQDYHRFHTPVSGTIVYHERFDGTIYSVNADAVMSNNLVLLNNQREVVVIRTPSQGDVAFVAVGATCVGSIELTVPMTDGSLINAQVTKGDEFGNFQFGGSTILLLLPNEHFVADNDVLDNTELVIETYIKVGARIARAR